MPAACWSSKASTVASTATSTRWVTSKAQRPSFESASRSWATRASGISSGWWVARYQRTGNSAKAEHLSECRRSEPAALPADRHQHALLPLGDELTLGLQGGCSFESSLPSTHFGFRLAGD